MASRVEDSGGLAKLFAAIVWVLCSVPLAAQSGDIAGARFHGGERADGGAELVSLSSDVPATADAVLEEMAQAAGLIFAGQVMAVRRPAGFAGSGEDAAEGVAEVDFRVDETVRGPAAGSVYTLREWSGVWSASGGERYRVGQRLLLFLYEPDTQGLSSPVHGRDGAIPLRGGGVAPGPDDSTDAAAQWMVDLRWVQARALRGDAAVAPTAGRPVHPRPIHGIFPEEGEVRRGVEAEADLVRRTPIPIPVSMAASATVEVQTLAQVLALCQQAMRPVNAGR